MIKDVIIKKIISHNDKRGFFREIFKTKKKSKNIILKQISHSFIKKNVIKAWHLHRKQSQWNYLLKGKIKVYLYDTRLKSKTFKKYSELNIDTKKDVIMYFFPAVSTDSYVILTKLLFSSLFSSSTRTISWSEKLLKYI